MEKQIENGDLYEDYANRKLRATHKHLGECFITFECLFMQLTNSDPSSMYVEHDGEIKEVTKALVSY